jgi:galactokinase
MILERVIKMNKENLIKTHKELFGVEPQTTILSPSRINIIGEHIDYLGGNVLPANIDLYMMGTFSKSDCFEIYSDNFQDAGIRKVEDQKNFKYDKTRGFLNYVLGCVQILRDNNFEVGGVSVAVSSIIPPSSGLSSSASFGVLIIKGLLKVYGYEVNGIEVAKLFKEVENKFMNLKNGIMDQFIIANGIENNLMLLNTSTLQFSNYEINLGDYQFVVFNTKKQRDLVGSKYNERVEETSKGLELINQTNTYENLTSIPLSKLDNELEKISNEIIKKRVKFAVEEQNRVNDFISLLPLNDYVAMGKILNEGHKGLKELYEVSCDESDFIVDQANAIDGILGARMTGAGFGGCVIVLTHKNSVKTLEQELVKKYNDKFGYPCEMYVIKVVDCAKDIN